MGDGIVEKGRFQAKKKPLRQKTQGPFFKDVKSS
jgi:hypothetical protein